MSRGLHSVLALLISVIVAGVLCLRTDAGVDQLAALGSLFSLRTIATYTAGTTPHVKGAGVSEMVAMVDEKVIEKTPKAEFPQARVSSSTMLFVGDMMFDRAVALHARKYGWDSLLAKVDPFFTSAGAVVGNLEGPVTDNKSLAEEDMHRMQFTFDPEVAQLLARHHVAAVSQANNHAYDYGVDGYRQSIAYLRAAGVVPFGSPRNEDAQPATLILQGKTICLFGYHDLYTRDASPLLKSLAKARDTCDREVVFAHWGEEYATSSTPRQRTLGHAFIDAGADLVIGAHPHVVEPQEIYRGKAIFYSLGNFVFDQNFSRATEHGLAVGVDWGACKTVFTLIPIAIVRGEVDMGASSNANITELSLPAGGANSNCAI